MPFTDYTTRFSQYRTDALRSQRSSSISFRNRDAMSQQLLSGGEEIVIKTDIAPSYIESQKEIDAEVAQLRNFLNTLQEEQNKHLTTAFGNDKKTRARIEALTVRVSSLFQHLERKIKAIGNTPNDASNEVKTIRQNLQRSMAAKITELSTEFRKNQKKYLTTLQSFDTDFDPQSNDPGFSESQTAHALLFSELVAEHTQDVSKITDQLNSISIIFKDMAALVVEQGSLIDQIDYNLLQAENETSSAVRHLENAADRMKRKRLNYCIALQFVVIFVLIVVYLKRRKD
ncbi:hypothetical protein RCL1_005561 [Eukaryota sp. TZLM3-RCL]